MSKFIDRLNRLARGTPEPLGFNTRQSAPPRPKIQLAASLAEKQAERLTDHIAGADAGLLSITELSSGIKNLQKLSQALPDIPWGAWLKGSSSREISQLIKVGSDFVVFPADSAPLMLLQNKDVGKIIEVEASLNEGLLRAANEMPVDAVLIAGEEKEDYFLTWRHLMLFQRFADLLTKPLLVSVPAKVSADELQALWQAGVDGVLVAISTEQPPDRLQELRGIIDRLPFPSPHQREGGGAWLPRMSREPGITTTEEEEEEEE